MEQRQDTDGFVKEMAQGEHFSEIHQFIPAMMVHHFVVWLEQCWGRIRIGLWRIMDLFYILEPFDKQANKQMRWQSK